MAVTGSGRVVLLSEWSDRFGGLRGVALADPQPMDRAAKPILRRSIILAPAHHHPETKAIWPFKTHEFPIADRWFGVFAQVGDMNAPTLTADSNRAHRVIAKVRGLN